MCIRDSSLTGQTFAQHLNLRILIGQMFYENTSRKTMLHTAYYELQGVTDVSICILIILLKTETQYLYF